MNLAKSMIALYRKYKKQLTLLVLLFFGYKIIKHFFPFSFPFSFQEGLVGATNCTQFTNCNQCVNGQVNNSNSPCYWNNQNKKCGSFKEPGYSETCTEPKPTPTKCDAVSNCNTCIASDCFWGDTDQKCSSTFKSGYGKICSGSNPNPNPNCPKCDVCPELTMLKIPTFITTQQ